MKIYDPERTGGKKAPMTLEGQTLFISGGSRGIGLAIALRAARDGANVALIAKTAEPHPKLEGTVYTAAAQIEAAGGHALPVVGDIRDEAQVERAVAQAVERFGGIDVCVNNASAINLSGTEAVRRPRLITSLIIQERLHRGGQAFRVRGQLQVAAAVDVQLAARYQPVHDPRIDQRDDRVVVTGHDQRRRPQPRQHRQAGPPDGGDQLVEVAPGRAQAGGGVQQVAFRFNVGRGLGHHSQPLAVHGAPFTVGDQALNLVSGLSCEMAIPTQARRRC
jgi:short chain dehydrogenase